MASERPCQFPPWRTGFCRNCLQDSVQDASHKLLAWWRSLGQVQGLRFTLFPGSHSFFLTVSDYIYLLFLLSLYFFLILPIYSYLWVFLLICPSLSDSLSFSFILSVSFLVILSFSIFLISQSFFFCFLISVYVCLGLIISIFLLFSFPSQSPQGLLKRISCYILGFLSRGVRDGDLGLNLNFSGVDWALQGEN